MNIFPLCLFLWVILCLVSTWFQVSLGLGIEWQWRNIGLDVVRRCRDVFDNLAVVAGRNLVLELGKSTGDAEVEEDKGLPSEET